MTQPASESRVLSARRVLSHSPEIFRGLPKKLRGLYRVAKQRKNPQNSLGSCLEQAARKYPQHEAVVFEGRTLTYAQLNSAADRLADYLKRTDTGKGDVVVVAMENRPELLIVISALSKVGAVAALINTSQRNEVLRHSVSLVKPKRVIVGSELLEHFEDIEDALPAAEQSRLCVPEYAHKSYVDKKKALQGWSSLPVFDYSPVVAPIVSAMSADDPLCYFYTSGTTGLPKAAILTNGRFMKAYGGIGEGCLQLRTNDRVYVPLPFYHATALVVAWSSILAGGACLVMARRFSASQYWNDVRSNKVTALCYIGELCRYLTALPESKSDRDHQVRMMFGNGLRPEIWQAFKARFGIDRVHEFYGSSEGNIGFMNVLNLDNTVGFSPVPYAIVEYDVENDEPIRHSNGFMKRVQTGQAGLLLGEISDKSPFDGYTEPQKTEKTILRNVFQQGDAWFNTGDLMRDLGFRHAQFVDRLGDTFRWKGENVSTTEVENLLSACEGVLDAVVYGVEIPKTNGRAGMAALRIGEATVSEREALLSRVLNALEASLPAYAVPHFVRFVDEIEVTGTHKYKKAPLKKDGFSPEACQQNVYVRLPGSKQFELLDDGIYSDILASKYRF